MLGSQTRKRLERAMKVSWREKPSSHDVAAMRDHRDRMGLVIKTRWQITAVLIAFAIGYFIVFGGSLTDQEIRHFGIPIITLLVSTLALNGLYQATYRRLANVAFLNWAQLLVDVVYIAALVYLTGGLTSFLWPMMLLIVIEGAVIIGPSGAWGLGLFAVVMLGVAYLLGGIEGLPTSTIPFGLGRVNPGADIRDHLVIYVWQAAVILGMALTSNSLLRILSRPQRLPASRTIVDEMTGLLSQPHFRKMLEIEIARAVRSGEGVHLLIIDLDDFGTFNERFGIDAGDAMIARVAEELSDVVSGSGGAPTSNMVARLGGEEFGVLFVQPIDHVGAPDAGDVARLAESIHERLSSIRVDGAGITVSIGIASAPDDGATTSSIIDAADAALSRAVERGGNRIEVTGSEPDEEDMIYLPIGPFDL